MDARDIPIAKGHTSAPRSNNQTGGTLEENEFRQAMDLWKRDNNCQWPTTCDVLGVLKALGYRKVARGGALQQQPTML